MRVATKMLTLYRANELMPRNTCVLVELAQVLLHGPDPDRAAAKDLLSRAATQFEKRSSSVSFQLLNNIGVLCLDLGLYDEVELSFGCEPPLQT